MVLYHCRLPHEALPFWTGDSIYSEPLIIERALKEKPRDPRPSMVLVQCGADSWDWTPWRYDEGRHSWVRDYQFEEED